MKLAVRWASPLVIGMLVVIAGFTMTGANEPRTRPTALLEESYRLIGQIDSPNRVYFLLPLTQAGSRIGTAQEEKWCKQMFQESFDVRDAWDRVALEKNALVALSFVNAAAAMDLLWRVEGPLADSRGDYPEDVRADGASTIFPNFFDSQMRTPGSGDAVENRLQATLGDIEHHAVHIGKTGEYPYHGMGSIIQKLDVRNGHQDAMNLIFGEALKFYSESKPKFRNRDSEFLGFLQAVVDKVSDPTLVHAAISELVTHLKSPTVQNDVSFQAEYRTANGDVVRFSDRNKSLLFRAVTLIRKQDPKLAKSIADEYPELKNAGEGMTYISGGVIEGSVSPDQAAAMRARMRQISLLSVIQAKQRNNPVEALDLTNELSDPGLKLIGVSDVLPGLMRVDAPAASAIYAERRTQLQEVADDQQRLQVLVALAKAAWAVKDDGDFKAFASRAFEQGSEMYREDYRQRPELRADLRRGYAELKDIVRFATAHNLNWAVDRIHSIQNVELRAHLLVFAAEGLAQQDKPDSNKD
jgi:hypothetical protein